MTTAALPIDPNMHFYHGVILLVLILSKTEFKPFTILILKVSHIHGFLSVLC